MDRIGRTDPRWVPALALTMKDAARLYKAARHLFRRPLHSSGRELGRSRSLSRSFLRGPQRDLGYSSSAVNELLEIVPDQITLDCQKFLRRPAAGERVQPIEIVLPALLRELHPFAGDVLHSIRQHPPARFRIAMHSMLRDNCSVACWAESPPMPSTRAI